MATGRRPRRGELLGPPADRRHQRAGALRGTPREGGVARKGRRRVGWLGAASSPGLPPRPRCLTPPPAARPHATQRRFGCRSAAGGAAEAGAGGGTAARATPRCAAPGRPSPSSLLDPAGGRGGAGSGCTGGRSVANKAEGACAARARQGAAQTAQQPACRRGRTAWVAPPPPRQGVPAARIYTRRGVRAAKRAARRAPVHRIYVGTVCRSPLWSQAACGGDTAGAGAAVQKDAGESSSFPPGWRPLRA